MIFKIFLTSIILLPISTMIVRGVEDMIEEGRATEKDKDKALFLFAFNILLTIISLIGIIWTSET